MGWVDSAPYSCAASDTARDIAVNSSEAKKWHFTKAQIRTLGRNENRIGQRWATKRQAPPCPQGVCWCRHLVHRTNNKETGQACCMEDLAWNTRRISPKWGRCQDPISAKSYTKGKAHSKQQNACWVLTLMAWTRPSSWRKTNEFPLLTILHQCTQGTTKAKRGISLQNSNRPRQNGTRLHGTLGELQATQPVQPDYTEATIRFLPPSRWSQVLLEAIISKRTNQQTNKQNNKQANKQTNE